MDGPLSQEEIDRLLSGQQGGGGDSAPSPAAGLSADGEPVTLTGAGLSDLGGTDAGESAAVKQAAERQPAAPSGPPATAVVDAPSVSAALAMPGMLAEAAVPSGGNLELMYDIPLEVSVELGRTTMSLAKVLSLGTGSIIQLNRLPGEHVDLLVNGRLVARGEIVVLNESFGLRVTDIVQKDAEA